MATVEQIHRQIRSSPEFADILRDREEFATGDEESLSDQMNGWFDTLMLQSGTEISPSMILALSVCAAITCGGSAWVIQENFLTTGMSALLGAFVPVISVVIARSRRQKKLTEQLPDMVDELARAAKTGRSLEQCLQLVAEDTPSPLGDELRLCVQKMELGMSISAAIKDLPHRTSVVSLNVLRTALTVHHQTGGDLISVLDRLSTTIRDRISYLGRLNAATAASRASAIMMLVIPPGVILFFLFRDPNYLERLIDSAWGRNITLAAIVLQVIGAAWVLRILKNSQQS